METPLDTQVYDPWMIKPSPAGNDPFEQPTAKSQRDLLLKDLKRSRYVLKFSMTKGMVPAVLDQHFLMPLKEFRQLCHLRYPKSHHGISIAVICYSSTGFLNVCIKIPTGAQHRRARTSAQRVGLHHKLPISLQHSLQISFGLLLEALHEVQYITCMCINR